jgi:photosystem II stability/assembly factor-like uncharacterized protein
MCIRPKAISTLFFFAAILSLFTACKKSSAPPPSTPPPPTVTNPSVTSLLSASLHPGDTVTILGKNLGTTIADLNISLNDSISLTLYQAKDSIVTVILPGASRFPYYGSRSFLLDFTLTGSPAYSDSLTVSVTVPEPKGWFKVYANSKAYSDFALQHVSIDFPTDSEGYLFTSDMTLKTRDGGDSWQQTGDSLVSSPTCMYVLDSSHLWYGGLFGNIISSSDAGNSWSGYAALNFQTTVLDGLYMSSPTSGQYVNGYGQIYSIAGSPGATTATLEYQSQNYGGFGGHQDVWTSLSNIDQNNLLIGGAFAVTVKTNGVYDEYSLPSSLTTAQIEQVQLVSSSLGFALDYSGNLFQYTGNRNWSSLNKQGTAFWFASVTTGYFADATNIYQTADGGQTWNPVFTLQSGDVVYAFAAHNGKVWAIGNNGTTAGFIYKYNP